MNYEQKYKEALSWMQSLYNGLHGKTKEEAERYFPELAVSEDEKIRKEMIEILKKESHEFPSSVIANKSSSWIAWLEKQNEPQDKGEISDGYHTFNELYYYRMLYNAAFFNMLPKEWVHKSKKHHDGEECFGGGWFIVMANLPTGQISNHYELKDWDLFQIPEKEVADKWDGHTPQEAADRLHKYLLEKQGEHKPVISDDALREGIAHYGITQYQIDNWMKKYVDVEGNYYEGVLRALRVDELYKLQEKQGKQILANSAKTRKDGYSPKFRVGDTIKCKYDDRQFTIKSVDFNKGTYTYTQENCGNDIDYADEEFELVEQKPVDKAQPKFKVGDWVVDKHRLKIYQVYSIDNSDNNYIRYSCKPLFNTNDDWACFHEDMIRPWTIQDAKDGDVLVFDDIIMIFKNIKTVCTANTYILYCNGDGIVVDDWCDFGPDARPATKEQRDFLFSKIKEAGYEWNPERMELKKIEQKQELSEEEINSLLSNLDSNIKEFVMTDEFENEIGGHYWAIAKHAFLLGLGSNLSNTRMELKKIEHKPTWSEDERIRENCIHFLELQKEHHAATFEIEECIDWLKSLKSQNQYDKGFNDGYSASKYNQWKPSEKQMEAIKFCCANFEEYDALQSLYNDLKNL